MEKITIYKCAYQSLWHFVAFLMLFSSPSSPSWCLQLMQPLQLASAADDDDAAFCTSCTPHKLPKHTESLECTWRTTSCITLLIRTWAFVLCAFTCGSSYTMGLPRWFMGLPQIMSKREKRHIVLDNTLFSLFYHWYYFHYLSFQSPLNLTPTARSGRGLYSLVKPIISELITHSPQQRALAFSISGTRKSHTHLCVYREGLLYFLIPLYAQTYNNDVLSAACLISSWALGSKSCQ